VCVLPVRLALWCSGDLTYLLRCVGVVCPQCRLFAENGSPMPTNAEGVNMPSGVNILSTVGRLLHLHMHACICAYLFCHMQTVIVGAGPRVNTHAMVPSMHFVSAVRHEYGRNMITQISLSLCALCRCAITIESAPLMLVQSAAGLLLPVQLCCACAVLTVSCPVVCCRGLFCRGSPV